MGSVVPLYSEYLEACHRNDQSDGIQKVSLIEFNYY